MKNKKIIIIIVLIAIILILSSVIAYIHLNKKETDAIKFKNEYEKLNGQTVVGSDKTYKSITIDKNNPIVYADYETIFEVLNDSGVIFFGFPECPWCRNAIPVLLDAAKEAGIDKIYYLNNMEDRDVRKLENDQVIVTKEGTDKYYELLDKLGHDFTREYSGLNDSDIRRLYFPTVVFVQNGKIISVHVATLESQTDSSIPLTEEQTDELKNIYIEGMTQTTMCSQSC